MGLKKMAVGLMAGLIMSRAYTPAWAKMLPSPPPEIMSPAEILYGPINWDVENRLPFYLKAGEVAGMSPTVDELRVSEQARSLLVEATTHARRYGVFCASRVRIEWEEGLNAYAQGRYQQAIADFHAALDFE